MSDPHSKNILLGKILKLFRLGSSQSGTTEAEMMAAITKAKVLMARHDISEREVQAAANALNAKEGTTIHYDIGSYTAYTRKMKSLARYDEIVAICVGNLTTTRPILHRTITVQGPYVSMRFVGTEFDVAVAAKLFMVFLQSVRARTRAVYGSANWDKNHTSYAIGFATRMEQRAKAMAEGLTPREQTSTALVVRSKVDAIAQFLGNMQLTKEKGKRKGVQNEAFTRGFIDGGSFNLGKSGLEE